MVRKRKETDEAKDGEQYARFVETAEKIGADDEEAFEAALKKIISVKPQRKKDKKGNGTTQ